MSILDQRYLVFAANCDLPIDSKMKQTNSQVQKTGVQAGQLELAACLVHFVRFAWTNQKIDVGFARIVKREESPNHQMRQGTRQNIPSKMRTNSWACCSLAIVLPYFGSKRLLKASNKAQPQKTRPTRDPSKASTFRSA